MWSKSAPTTMAMTATSAVHSSLSAALVDLPLAPAAAATPSDAPAAVVSAGAAAAPPSSAVEGPSLAVTKTMCVDVDRPVEVDDVGVPSTTVTTTLDSVTTCTDGDADTTTPSEVDSEAEAMVPAAAKGARLVVSVSSSPTPSVDDALAESSSDDPDDDGDVASCEAAEEADEAVELAAVNWVSFGFVRLSADDEENEAKVADEPPSCSLSELADDA